MFKLHIHVIQMLCVTKPHSQNNEARKCDEECRLLFVTVPSKLRREAAREVLVNLLPFYILTIGTLRIVKYV